MRLLLILSESWNDRTRPNNNMTNWFTGFPGLEIWTISGSGIRPENRCCSHHFLFHENKMLKSLFTCKPVGEHVILNQSDISSVRSNEGVELSSNRTLKKYLASDPIRLCQDFVWRFGKYNLPALRGFVQECNPDLVFSIRTATIKTCRLETIVSSMTSAPMVVYTGDDEYSLQQFFLSPFSWIRRLWTRSWLKKTIPLYRVIFSQSERQMAEFRRDFGSQTEFLVKCGEFSKEKIHRTVGKPIQLIFAGKLYCNRWKTLGMVAKAIRAINAEAHELLLQLNIYTGDVITWRQDRLLNDGVHSIIHGSVTPKKLEEVYQNGDIAMHVESFDLRNRLLTKDSFSTKVIDLLASGCAVMAVCWEKHAAGQYLRAKDAAMVVNSQNEILAILRRISRQPDLILEYAQKAYQCGMANHQRHIVQKQLMDCFQRVINENKNHSGVD